MKRRVKTQILVALAVFWTVVIAACASKEEQRAEKIEGINRLTWEDISALNGGEMPELRYDDFGNVNTIAGAFAEFEVRNEEDALLSLYGVADLFGFEEPVDEFVLYSKSDGPAGYVYTFDQYYEGIPVLGGFASIHVDESLKTEYLIVTYNKKYPSSLQPDIARDQVEEIIKQNCNGNSVDTAELVLYPEEGYIGELVLCWQVETTGGPETAERVFINAKTGEIIYGEPLYIS